MTFSNGFARLAALLSVTAAVSVGCSHAQARGGPSTANAHTEAESLAAMAAERKEDAAMAPARTHQVASLPRKTLGPFMSQSSIGALVVWAAPPAHGPGQDLVVVPLAPDGAPLGAGAVATTLPDQVTSLIVRPAGSRGGWIVAWSALLDRGESISTMAIRANGAPMGVPVDVQRTDDHVAWLDVVATREGAVCLWAQETPSGDADILSTAVTAEGKPRGVPVRVARGVDRWQDVQTSDGVGLALVDGTDAAPRANEPRGALRWQRLDADGKPEAPSVIIDPHAPVSSDLDLVAVRGGWLLGWTDLTGATGEDSAVELAFVGESGRIEGPTTLSTLGSSSLVALAGGPSGAALAWEAPRAKGHPRRELHLAQVDLGHSVSTREAVSFDVGPPAVPALVATDDGFALLASAPACPAGAASCTERIVPTVVRLSATLEAQQAEPLLLGEDHLAAAVAWDLRCAGSNCLALAATNAAPTLVSVASIPRRNSPFKLPLVASPPSGIPRVSEVSTLASVPPIADLAVTRLRDADLVVTVADTVRSLPPAPNDDHRRQGTATVLSEAVDAQARPFSPPATVSTRAIAAGGVAVSSGTVNAAESAAIAWVKRDGDESEVHLALLDPRGKRSNERQLTSQKGEATNVALAPADDGWLAAWVNSHDGHGAVYVSKVGHDLTRSGRERRVTSAAADASDISLLVRDGVGWIAWSDSREMPLEGLGDIYVARVRAKDGARLTDEERVLATAQHSRSPSIAALPDGGALLAWIEDPPTGIEGLGSAMLARLDSNAHPIGVPTKLPLAGNGRPTSLAMAESDGSVRLVVGRDAGDAVSLDALSLAYDGTVKVPPWRLLELSAPPPFDVMLVLAGNKLFFDDAGVTGGAHRIRCASIAW